MLPDHINGLFEFAGGALLLKNVRALIRDKKISGISWLPVLFFSTWGLWNLYYYPSLGQWWSFTGGLFVCSANWLWLILLAYYSFRRRTPAP